MTLALTGSEDDKISPRKLIPFPKSSEANTAPQTTSGLTNRYVEATSPNLRRSANTHLGRKSLEEEFSRVLTEENKKYLDDAFLRLINATDTEINQIERSNNFDEWKDLLVIVSRKAMLLTLNHRKILGALISAVNDSDIVNFDNHVLKLFLDSTNVLRQPRINNLDSDRIISKLIDNDVNILLPLSVKDDDSILSKNLDSLLEKLVNKGEEESGSSR